jgi:hypothetical protein
VFWSSVGGKPYPVSIRGVSFEDLYAVADAKYNRDAVPTYAHRMRDRFEQAVPEAVEGREPSEINNGKETVEEAPVKDVLGSLEDRCVKALKQDTDKKGKIESDEGIAWGSLKAFFREILTDTVEDVDTVAYHMVAKVMDRVYGEQNQAWHTYKHASRKTTYVKKGRLP